MRKKTMNKTLIWGIGLLLLMAFRIGLPAQTVEKTIKGMVIFDFTSYVPNNTNQEPKQESKQVPIIYSIFDSKTIEEIGKPTENDEENSKMVEAVLNKLQEKSAETIDQWRWYTKKNEQIQVYAFYDNNGGDMAISVKEESRKTQIEKDIASFTQLLLKRLTAKAIEEREVIKYKIAQKQHCLKYPRSTITVTANYTLPQGKTQDSNSSTGEPGKGNAEEPEKGNAKEPEKGNAKEPEKMENRVEIITGDAEHFFLSADVPFKKTAELKYNETNGTIELKDKPTEFYLGINFMFGDLTAERPNLSLKNFFLKAMFRFSKRPLDSYGFALGYRFPEKKILGLNLSPFSVFWGYIGTKEEKIDEADKSKRKFKPTFGLSFNLDKALEWIK